MKLQQEYLVLKNIGSFKSGQVITNLTIELASGTYMIVDLSKSPDWFKPMRGSWIPQVGDKFYYLDEGIKVQSDTLKEPVETIDPKSVIGLRLAAGNFFKEQVQALNAGHAVKETFEKHNVELAMEESRLKVSKENTKPDSGVSGALR